MPQIFISYPREYRPLVERLVGDLRSSGYEPFFDEHLTGGQRWWDELLDRIEGSRAFMPVIGAGFLGSTPCRLEAQYAASLGKPFLPIAVEPTPPQLFPESIASAHWTDYDPDRSGSIFAVIRAINGLPPSSELPAVRPERPVVPISYMTELQNEIASEEEMGRARQLAILADLKCRLDGADREAAVVLLGRLRQRPDVSYHAAKDIDEILRVRDGPASSTRRSSETETETETGPSHEPVRGPAHPGGGPPPHVDRGPPQPEAPQQHRQFVAPPVAGRPVPGKPDNYLVWSVLSTFCCNPGGIVAIVYSNRVDTLWRAGRAAEAKSAATTALWWALASAPCAIVLWSLVYVVALALSDPTTP